MTEGWIMSGDVTLWDRLMPAGLTPAPDSTHRWRRQEVISEFTCWAEQMLLMRWVNLLFTHLQTFLVLPEGSGSESRRSEGWNIRARLQTLTRLKHVPVVFKWVSVRRQKSPTQISDVKQNVSNHDFMWKLHEQRGSSESVNRITSSTEQLMISSKCLQRVKDMKRRVCVAAFNRYLI